MLGCEFRVRIDIDHRHLETITCDGPNQFFMSFLAEMTAFARVKNQLKFVRRGDSGKSLKSTDKSFNEMKHVRKFCLLVTIESADVCDSVGSDSHCPDRSPDDQRGQATMLRHSQVSHYLLF